MSPQVDMEKKALEQLFLDAYKNKVEIVNINEVFVNVNEIQFIKVVEIPVQIAKESILSWVEGDKVPTYDGLIAAE